jgi:1-acyl-sn-glycerol-3-phosphate acyltransferase
LRQLAQTILDRLDPAVRLAAARASAGGAGKCQQVWCPVCALAALVNGEQHPLLSVIAEHSVALLAVVRATHRVRPVGSRRRATAERARPLSTHPGDRRGVTCTSGPRLRGRCSWAWVKLSQGTVRVPDAGGSMWYWLFKYIFMGPLLSLLGRPKTQGLEYVPDSGPVILASNHLAVADSFYLPLVVRRRITFLAKAEYFTGTGIKGWFNRWFYTAAGQVPIDRTDADSAQAALVTAERIVGQGKLLGMYPEGTRSPDGRLYKGKTGLARLALESGVPVIPVAMVGTDDVNPLGSKMWRFGRVEVRFGKPMDFSRFEGLAGNRFIERAVIDEVMYELMQLSGQEYVDLYAADVKESIDRRDDGQPPARFPAAAAG